MPFAYYDRLSARDQATSRRSDQIASIVLSRPEASHPFVAMLREAFGPDGYSCVRLAARSLRVGGSRS